MTQPEIFRLKTTELLGRQVSEVSSVLGEPISRLSLCNTDLELSPVELKERFPVRYQAYLDTLRKTRNHQVPDYLYTRRLHTLNALDRYIVTHYSEDESKRTLFEPQMNAFEALRLSLESGETDGYIRLPTGSGKTVLFTEFVEATTPQTLIVVPTRILVGQTEEKFRQFAPTVETGKVYSDAKQYDKPVTITTYASFLRGVENGKINPADYDLLILDEAHKSLSPRRVAAVQKFDQAIKVGFTATPRYTENKHLGNLLNTEIHRMGIREAVEEGLLASLSVYIAKTDVDLSGVRITSSGEYNDDDLEQAVNIKVRNTAAVDLYKAMFLGQPAVAYCVSVKHAEDLAASFNQNGISAGVVNSYQNISEQDAILRKFKAGGLQVICNADLLIEGFDDPRVNICLNLRPTASPVVAEQRAGRVLRPDPNNPFKHAYIVDFMDEFGKPNRFPVSFAQIIEAAHVFRKSDPPDYYRSKTKGIGPVRYPEIEILGLKVITDAEEVMDVVSAIIDSKYEPVREGWLSFTALNNRFRLGPRALQRVLDNFRESNPEDFKIFLTSHGKAAEYLSPRLVAAVKDIKDKMQAPVEGWMNMTAIEAALNISRPTLQNLINEHRGANPGSFRVFKRADGQIIEYFSPELVALIKEMAVASGITAETPPDNWMTYRQAASRVGVDKGTVERFANQYQSQQPEYFGKFKRRGSPRVAGYISPSVVGTLKGELDKFPQAGEEWVNPKTLAAEFGISVVVVRNLAERHRGGLPQEFRDLKNKSGVVIEHLSSALTTQLRAEIATYLHKPEDSWVDRRLAHRALGISHTTADKRLAEYHKTYPQYFRLFVDPNIRAGQRAIREFIAPQLVELLRNDVLGIEAVPEGWMCAHGIEEELAIKAAKIRTYVRKYRDSNPEYFRVLVGKGHHLTQYFSPELIALIKHTYSEK